MPSQKYAWSCCGLMSVNGRMAIEGIGASPNAAVGLSATASIAKRRSLADWKRSSARFSRHRRATRNNACDVAPEGVRTGGSALRTAIIASAAVSPEKARCPLSIS
jgi:hypothetical protein